MFCPSFLYSFVTGLILISPALAAQPPSKKCTELKLLHLENATVLNATHVSAGSNITTPKGSCQQTAIVSSAVCRVQVNVTTSPSSSVRFEAWLPDEDKWFGRFLGLGNGGLDGCGYSFALFLINSNFSLSNRH